MNHALTEEQIKSLESIRNYYYADKIDPTEYALDRIERLLLHNKFEKFNEKAFKKIFEGKHFSYQEDKILITFKVKSPNILDTHFVKLVEQSTRFGKLYFFILKSKRAYCFTGHFFDRMQERLNIPSRLQAIKQLIAFFIDDIISHLRDEDSNYINMRVSNGMAKGIVYDNVYIFKTFIGDNTLSLNDKQCVNDLIEMKRKILSF